MLAVALDVVRALGLLRVPSPAEIERRRNEGLARVVAHAHARVPFYRALLDRHGIDPASIRGVDDLPRLPITTRADLQAAAKGDVVSELADPSRLRPRYTSGSSGRPLTIWATPEENWRLLLIWWRALRAQGGKLLDRRAELRLGDESRGAAGAAPHRDGAPVPRKRTLHLDCRLPRERNLEALCGHAPDWLLGYAGALAHVAAIMDDSHRHRLRRLRSIASTGEMLTPALRAAIERGFGVRVHDTHASLEFGLISWQCPQGADLHCCDDAVIVEVLKDGRPAGPGERGVLVATSLSAFSMPFIRYQLGDIVTQGEPRCACGAPFATFRGVVGRQLEYFPMPDGSFLHPYDLSFPVIKGLAGLRQYQLVQERPDAFVMRVVMAVPPDPAALARLAIGAAGVLGPGLAFRFEIVDDIPMESSGKYRQAVPWRA